MQSTCSPTSFASIIDQGNFFPQFFMTTIYIQPPKKTIILQLQNDCVEILNTCQLNYWQQIRPSVTHVTALVEVTDRCKVLMSPEPDPPEERLTTSYGSHPPYARSLAHTDTESSANGKNMRYTVALDAALLICKLEDQGSAVRFFGFFGPHRWCDLGDLKAKRSAAAAAVHRWT